MRSALTIPAEPLISVVMPVRDAERFIGDAVRSLQGQTYERWELIVVDSSNDGSRSVVEAAASTDTRIRVVSDPPGSRGRAINKGVALARGDLIARMDADDISLPQRFEVQLAWMRKTGVQVCGSWIQNFGDEEGLVWFPETHDDIGRELVFRYALCQPTVLMHAEIPRAHPYREEAVFEGHELFTRLIERYRLGSVPAVLLKSRSHRRQAHVVEGAGCSTDARRCRPRLFSALYPDAEQPDIDAICALADNDPLSTLSELECAGGWLVRFARDSADPLIRRQMFRRWRFACRRSAHLGPDAYRAYARLRPEFGLAVPSGDRALWAACALRVTWNSRVDRGLRRIRRVPVHPAVGQAS